MKRSRERTVAGTFEHLDLALKALRGSRDKGLRAVEFYSPVPVEEAEELLEQGRSPVRFFTFAGAVTGLASGMALAMLSSLTYNLVVGGKPVLAPVPFLVVGFEFLILLGGIFTLLGLLTLAGLPARKFPPPLYRPEFSDDRFGLVLACKPDDVKSAREFLRSSGAQRVEVQEEEAAKS